MQLRLKNAGLLHRRMARGSGQQSAIALVGIHRGADRQAQAQRVLAQLAGVFELHAHGHALRDFDPIARGVLRGQKRKCAACTHAQAVDFALISHLAAIDVGRDFYGLP